MTKDAWIFAIVELSWVLAFLWQLWWFSNKERLDKWNAEVLTPMSYGTMFVASVLWPMIVMFMFMDWLSKPIKRHSAAPSRQEEKK